MELIRGLYNLRPSHQGCVATIGNFDGVHLGHQAIIGQLAEKSAELGLPSTIITFEPHPQEYFAKTSAPPRLTRLREKILVLRRFTLDRVLYLRFNEKLTQMTAQDFIQTLLIDGLGVRCLVVGDDFRFGYRREGNLKMLQAAGENAGFQVINMHTFNVENERVSSTRIRKALLEADLPLAATLLGRAYRMAGRIVHGQKRGRILGFPTANIYLHRIQTPLTGVFTVEVFGLAKEPLKGIANIGARPTVNGQSCLLEVHLLDFDEDIYGHHVQVEFITKLRDEIKFESLDALKAQIQQDEQQARHFFSTLP